MGTFDSVYINKLNKLQEENNKLKTALRMIVEAAGDPPGELPFNPIGIAPEDLDDVFPQYQSPPGTAPVGPRPTNFPNPRGIPFWKWVRQLGNPINYQQWQDWVHQWQTMNPGVPFGNKPGRYRDFLDEYEGWQNDQEARRQQELWRDVDPNFKPKPVRPPTKPGWGGRLWRAVKPLISQAPTQNNPTQTTASSVPNGNSQPEVM